MLLTPPLGEIDEDAAHTGQDVRPTPIRLTEPAIRGAQMFDRPHAGKRPHRSLAFTGFAVHERAMTEGRLTLAEASGADRETAELILKRHDQLAKIMDPLG